MSHKIEAHERFSVSDIINVNIYQHFIQENYLFMCHECIRSYVYYVYILLYFIVYNFLLYPVSIVSHRTINQSTANINSQQFVFNVQISLTYFHVI